MGKHAVRNSLITVTTVVGLQLGALISGAVITEQIFVIPGFGRLTIDAVNQRDYALLQGVVLVAAAGYVVVNLLVDVAYSLLNPRIRVSGLGMSYVDRGLRRDQPARPPAPAPAQAVPASAARGHRPRSPRSSSSVAAILAPVVAPYSASATDFNATLAPPFSHGHLLGTDELGRDVLSRIIWGSRASIQAGVLATLLAMVIAVPIGLIAGYYRGWIDPVIARLTDVLLAFPFLILAVGLAAILGPSLTNATLALGIGAVPGLIRIARGEALALREEDYVRAAVANGASDAGILARHIFPNMLSTLIVQATVTIPAAIIGEAVLSFLGLGVQPPTPSWGVMLADAQSYVSQAPRLALSSGHRDLRRARCRSTCSATACATSSIHGQRVEPPRRARPVGALRHRRRRGPRGRQAFVLARGGRGARHRRRVGLRQERQRDVAAAPAAADGPRDRARRLRRGRPAGRAARTCSPRPRA